MTRAAAAGALAILAACERSPDAAPPAADARRAPTAAPRRVLLATLDTTRADRLGCYGRADARTPFLDEMAAQGVRFEHAWCAAPITLPSHATILSGIHPCGHGVRDNGIFVLDDGATLVSEVLAREGFATAAFVGSFILDARFGLNQGFGAYRGPPPSRIGLKPEVIERPAEEVVDDAIAWLDSLAADASFFLWVHFYDPHAPHEPPKGAARDASRPGAVASGVRDVYQDEISHCDAELARLRRRIDERGLASGLLEIATADHGEGLGEHGEETHGLLLHDATMRVPLLVRGEGFPAGGVVRAPVGNGQIAPAIVAWLGLPAAALPEARLGPLPAVDPAEGGGGEEDADAAPLLLETFLPFHMHRWQPLHGIVARGKKLVRGRFDELFDLASDPGETKDLAKEQAPLAAALARRLERAFEEEPRLPAPGDPVLSAEEREQMRALGYSGATAPPEPGADASLPDPRESVHDAATQARALALLKQARGVLGLDAALAQTGGVAPGAAQRELGARLLDEARALLASLAPKHPNDPSLAFDRGNVELAAARPADAVPHFEQATLADPSSSTCHYNLAIAYAGSGGIDLAIAEMEKAIHCEPRLELGWRWLVRTHEQRGELGRAVWWADRLEAAGVLDPRELPPMRAMREAMRARMQAAGQSPSPSPTFPPPDLRPEGVRAAGGGR